ncbi:MAG: hypothetical protein ACI3V2_09035 [Faecousia sp.]
MADFKQMYFHIAHATEEAIRLLVQAQQECEELYLATETEALSIQIMDHRKQTEPPAEQP